MKQEIENRFQLLLTMSLFLPVFLYNLGRVAGYKETDVISLSLKASILVGLHLLNYIIFQRRKNDLAEKSLGRISKWLLIAIGAFAFPIIAIPTLAVINPPAALASPLASISSLGIILILAFSPVIETILLFSTDKQRPKSHG